MNYTSNIAQSAIPIINVELIWHWIKVILSGTCRGIGTETLIGVADSDS